MRQAAIQPHLARPTAPVLQVGPVLSAIFPVNNEASTIGRILLELVAALPGVQKQTIIVDDCSNDGTAEWLRQYFGQSQGVSPDPPLQAQAVRL